MDRSRRRSSACGRRALFALFGGGVLAAPALAQPAWPVGPVRFICVFPPGGSTDLLSRLWCARMTEITGQQFIVDNRAGSGGTVGTEAIARAHPDGATIGLASVGPMSIAPTLYRRLPYDVNRDFAWICGLWQLPNLLVVRNELPARSLPELIALCRAAPGRHSYASSGAGTTLHLAGEMFKQMAGLDILHVPYRGGGPAYVDLLAGRVDMIFGNFPEASRLAREGKVRPLATTGAERSPQMPDVPALAEVLPGFEITSWGGACGPAGIPPPLAARIALLGREALGQPELRRRFEEGGATPWWTTPEGLAEFRRENEARFAPLIRASGAVVE